MVDNKLQNALVQTVKHAAKNSPLFKPTKFEPMTDEELEAWRNERDKNYHDRAIADLARKKAKAFKQDSMYPGNRVISFKFTDWKPDRQANTNNAKELGNTAWKLSHELLTEYYNVALIGNAGVGKTSLALAMLDVISEKKSTMFIGTTDLKRLLQTSWIDKSLIQKLDNIERSMKEVDVLLLDDLGTEVNMKQDSITEATQSWQELLYRVFTARTIQPNQDKMNKATIITTNNNYSELSSMYNDKLISRLIPKDSSGHLLVFKKLNDLREV